MEASVELQVSKLLASVAEYKASDLHLTVGSPPLLRIAGKITPLASEPLLTPEFVETIVLSMLSEEQKAILDAHKSIIFAHEFKSKTRYKVHAYYQSGYLSATFRLVPSIVTPITALDMPQELINVAGFEQGLIFVTGEYGSGKTTTLAGFVEYYNQMFSKHIITFESPIEFLYNDNKSVIEQLEIGQDIASVSDIPTFINSEDADIVVVSASLDKAMVDTAMTIARMGKLVLVEAGFATIRDLLEGILAMYESDHVGIREALASTVKSIIALKALSNTSGGLSIAAEVMVMTPGAYNLIKQDTLDKLPLLLENGRNEGMISMQQSIDALIQSGTISPRA